ncbi:ribonuclease H-like domain-containing protein [Xylogone sp. PMI_703]|nr:ribonuclease H-like domain-containing protein [Xylogone sp. PMI_703]
MSGFEEAVGQASEALRATSSTPTVGRLLSSHASPLSSRSLKIWRKDQAIVFSNSGREVQGLTRSISTTVVSGTAHDLILNTVSEYNTKSTNKSDGNLSSASQSNNIPSETEGETSDSRAKDEDGNKDGQTPKIVGNGLPKDYDELPPSNLLFKISEDAFKKAKLAPVDSEESFWSHTMYRGPEIDGVPQRVKVHYCKTKHTSERVIETYFKDKKVLGLDLEWSPQAYRGESAKKNVSVIQLATEDRIGLFHIALFPKDEVKDLVVDSLKKILEDPEITKVGVHIGGDCTRLRNYLGIKPRGIFELSHLYKLVKFSESKDFSQINKRLVSLATQVNEHLHLPIFKGDVRSSDWTKPLQLDQIVYAASDSYAGIQLYETMEIKRKALNPVPPRPAHAELNQPIRVAEGVNIPTDDEGAEEADDAETEASDLNKRRRKLSPSYLESASKDVEVDSDEISEPISKGSKKTPKSTIVLTADILTAMYRDTHPNHRAAPASLRSYFIWRNNESLSIPEIAALLRDIPLQTSTVTGYILEALRLEKLPFDKDRLQELLDTQPENVLNSRYRSLRRAVEESG